MGLRLKLPKSMKSAEWRLNWRDNHIAQKLWDSIALSIQTITLVCLKTAWDLPADPAANKQHSQIKTEHCVSFRRRLSTLKLIWCVIYLASEKYTVSYAYFTIWKINASAVWGPTEAWGPWARARRAHWIRRHWTWVLDCTQWFCEAGGAPDEARLEQTPYPFQPH